MRTRFRKPLLYPRSYVGSFVGPDEMEAISRSAAMIKLAVAGFVTALSVVALTVSPALADRPAVPSGTPTLKLASQLGPSRGGASALSRGYVPLHAREYALAKAAANAKAGVGNGNGHPKPKPGAGAPTIFNPPNVAPSFDGIYQSGVTPPDTT